MRTRHPVLVLAALLLAGISACTQGTDGPLSPASALYSTSESLSVLLKAEATTQQTVSQQIGPEGGTFLLPDGHKIVFPAGALDSLTTISATTDDDKVKVTFAPHGLLFPDSAQPVLDISYKTATVLDPSTLKSVYLDATGTITEVLTTEVFAKDKIIRSYLKHFSDYAAAAP